MSETSSRPTSSVVSNSGTDDPVSEKSENLVNYRRPPPVPRPATVGRTPANSSRSRPAYRNESGGGTGNNETPNARCVAAVPVNRRLLESPTVGVKKQPPLPPTRPVEFNFLTRERAIAHTKSELAKEEMSNDLTKCFEALDSDEAVTAPLPTKKHTIAVQPFNFQTDRRDKAYKEKQREKLEKEEEQRRKAMQFRAKAMPNFNRAVFCPVLEKRATEPENVEFKTSKRLQERKNFDIYVKTKDDERAEAMRQRESEKQRLEEEELRKLRNATVHHAQPVKWCKPFQIKHEAGHVTVPAPPKFRVDVRLRERSSSRNRNISHD